MSGKTPDIYTNEVESIDITGSAADSVLFNHDRIYSHNVLRVNYTSYDVRRAQDVINPNTSHCNVMMLQAPSVDEGCSGPPFCYARVLGIYHANVVYTGPGMVNYQPHRMEFLWVRWYHQIDAARTGWKYRKLDRANFAPISAAGAFGFVDPSDILRACHLIPVFHKGLQHVDGHGFSRFAQDSSDWVEYYINRCVFLCRLATSNLFDSIL